MPRPKKNLPTVRPVGRPTDYRQEYCAMLIDHMAQGFSFESFGGVVGSCKQTMYSWLENFPEFLDAKSQGRARALLFWERAGNSGALGYLPNFNASAYIFNMKNRFGWRDKQPDEEVSTNKNLSIDDAIKLANLLSKEK